MERDAADKKYTNLDYYHIESPLPAEYIFDFVANAGPQYQAMCVSSLPWLRNTR
jgi:hypothetical protein